MTGRATTHALSRRDGFTLLEILVALAVFGFVLSGLAQGVRYGLQAQKAQASIYGGYGDLDAVGRALRHMIEVMDPGDGVDPAPIAASHDRLEFITTLPNSAGPNSAGPNSAGPNSAGPNSAGPNSAGPDGAGAPPAQPVEATLLLDQAHRLVLRWRTHLHAERLGPPPTPIATELLHDVARVEISFWRPSSGWVTVWRYAGLPALVRIRLTFPPGDPRHWPDLVAAPLLNPP
jgi:general secretion pathway protein J